MRNPVSETSFARWHGRDLLIPSLRRAVFASMLLAPLALDSTVIAITKAHRSVGSRAQQQMSLELSARV